MKCFASLLLPLVASSISAGCFGHLDKYRKPEASSSSTRNFAAPADLDATNVGPRPSTERAEVSQPSNGTRAAPRATIYALDKHTFRFELKEADVWETALNVLLRNYNLTIVDRDTGVISTEWDSFFLDRSVFRNKVSLRISKTSRQSVDVTIHNNVERLRDASQAVETVGAVWLPADDPANEVARLVQNMALVLNQPPPVFPPRSSVARGEKPEGSSVQ